jgi:DNA-binding NarL/FixJ family response regulator
LGAQPSVRFQIGLCLPTGYRRPRLARGRGFCTRSTRGGTATVESVMCESKMSASLALMRRRHVVLTELPTKCAISFAVRVCEPFILRCMNRVRVLLVDDHDFTRSTVAASLRAEGCTVVASVPSARDAMLAFREQEIDCAVIDLNLGRGPNGIDLAYALRAYEPNVAIVLLTLHNDRRLVSGDKRPLPPGTVFLVKGDVRSTGQLREAIDAAITGLKSSSRRISEQLPLTDVQMEIVRMLVDGLTNAEIANRRGVSERSVQAALGRILTSLEIEPVSGQNPRMLILRACGALGHGVSP